MKRRTLHPKRAGPAANFAWGWSVIAFCPVSFLGQKVA